MNRKGQALIEFIILLPILIFIIFGIIDFGIIYSKKNNLESVINDVVDMYKNSESFENINEYLDKNFENLKLNITNEDNKFVSFILSEDIKTITPGLNLFIGAPYVIETKRVIFYEQ